MSRPSPLLLLLVLSLVCLLTVSAQPIPSRTADRILGGFVPSSVSSPRNNGAAVFLAQTNTRIFSLSLDGGLLFPPLDLGSFTPSLKMFGKLAADRSDLYGSRVWVLVGTDCMWNCPAGSLWLLDLSTKSVLYELQLGDLELSPAPASNASELIDVDGAGVVLFANSGRVYTVDTATGLQIGSFPLPDNGYAAIDVDVYGYLWVLQAQNGGSNALTLWGYTQQGEQIYKGQPDLSDTPQQLVAAMVVDDQYTAWISLVKTGEVFSWNAETGARGPTVSTSITSDFIGPILTAINASTIALAHKVEGAVEVIDISANRPSTIIRSPIAPLDRAYELVYSSAAQTMLVRVQAGPMQQILSVNPSTGELLSSFNISGVGFRSNIVQDPSSGLLYVQDNLGSKPTGASAVSVLDPTYGLLGQFPLKVYYAASAIAWDSVNQLLALTQVGSINSGNILYYTNEGLANGSVSVPFAQGFVSSMAYTTINGTQRVLLQLTYAAVSALNSEGQVVASFTQPDLSWQAMAVDDEAGLIYVLGYSGIHQSRVVVFDAYSGEVIECLTPPAIWPQSQEMLGLALDGDGNVYATSTTYSGIAVWAATTPRTNKLQHSRTTRAEAATVAAE